MQCWRSTLQLGRKERRWYKHRKLRVIVVCSSCRQRRNCRNFKFFCLVWSFAKDYMELLLSLCRTCITLIFPRSTNQIRELKQPRRRPQQQRRQSTYLTMKNSSFARFARAFFIFGDLPDVLVLSTTWNYLFGSCVNDVNIWRQVFFCRLTSEREEEQNREEGEMAQKKLGGRRNRGKK